MLICDKIGLIDYSLNIAHIFVTLCFSLCHCSPPLTQFFLECGGMVRTDKKPALCKSYQKLVSDLWHKNRWVLLLDLFGFGFWSKCVLIRFWLHLDYLPMFSIPPPKGMGKFYFTASLETHFFCSSVIWLFSYAGHPMWSQPTYSKESRP